MKTIKITKKELQKILEGLEQVGLQDSYIDYDFSYEVKEDVHFLMGKFEDE